MRGSVRITIRLRSSDCSTQEANKKDMCACFILVDDESKCCGTAAGSFDHLLFKKTSPQNAHMKLYYMVEFSTFEQLPRKPFTCS